VWNVAKRRNEPPVLPIPSCTFRSASTLEGASASRGFGFSVDSHVVTNLSRKKREHYIKILNLETMVCFQFLELSCQVSVEQIFLLYDLMEFLQLRLR